MASIHQVNHPGSELKISYKSRQRHKADYYFLQNSSKKGVRLWNRSKINGKDNPHKRKFIEFNGNYISDLQNLQEKADVLRFWGEYEGFSEFELLNISSDIEYWNNPYAVHRPFFYYYNGEQNTDPYVFGNEFYYAVCKKENLRDLQIGDLVLFGSEFGKRDSAKFHLDTLFIIKDEIKIDLSKFDHIYVESTLKRLDTQGCCPKVKSVHRGLKFTDVKNRSNPIFSFVPCKPANAGNISFGRPIIDTKKYGDLLRVPGAYTGYKSSKLVNETVENLWNKIATDILNQGYYLGTHFENLNHFNVLPK